jgi:hypothetical protein
MKHIKKFEFYNTKEFTRDSEPEINDYVRLNEDFYESKIPEYFTPRKNDTDYKYRIGKIIGYNEHTEYYNVKFDKYELWNNNFLVKREQIKSYSKKIEDLENLPSVGDYCLIGFSGYYDLCEVIKKERNINLRWSSINYSLKRLNPGPHDGKGLIDASDELIRHWSSDINDMISIIAASKFNL